MKAPSNGALKQEDLDNGLKDVGLGEEAEKDGAAFLGMPDHFFGLIDHILTIFGQCHSQIRQFEGMFPQNGLD